MSKPTLLDEKRAEFVLRDWERSHTFNVKLHAMRPTEENQKAAMASKDMVTLAQAELMRVQRARRPAPRELVPA